MQAEQLAFEQEVHNVTVKKYEKFLSSMTKVGLPSETAAKKYLVQLWYQRLVDVLEDFFDDYRSKTRYKQRWDVLGEVLRKLLIAKRIKTKTNKKNVVEPMERGRGVPKKTDDDYSLSHYPFGSSAKPLMSTELNSEEITQEDVDQEFREVAQKIAVIALHTTLNKVSG